MRDAGNPISSSLRHRSVWWYITWGRPNGMPSASRLRRLFRKVVGPKLDYLVSLEGVTLSSFKPVNELRKRVAKNLMSCTKRPDRQKKICLQLTHNLASGRLRTSIKAIPVNIIGWLGRTLHLHRNHNTPGGVIHALSIHASVDNQR